VSLYCIFNQGEIAGLAAGWRSVIALAPGRKWVTVVDWTTLETARLPLDLWPRLRPQQANGYSARRIRAAIRPAPAKAGGAATLYPENQDHQHRSPPAQIIRLGRSSFPAFIRLTINKFFGITEGCNNKHRKFMFMNCTAS
jgi:hypothetical protein